MFQETGFVWVANILGKRFYKSSIFIGQTVTNKEKIFSFSYAMLCNLIARSCEDFSSAICPKTGDVQVTELRPPGLIVSNPLILNALLSTVVFSDNSTLKCQTLWQVVRKQPLNLLN